MSRLISFVVLIAIIVVIGLLFYRVLIGFFIPVFLAAVLVVVFRPLHQWVLEKTGHRDRLAAAVTTLLIFLCLFLPIVVVGSAAATQGLHIIEENDTATLRLRLSRIRESLGLQMPEFDEQLRVAESEIQKVVEASIGASSTEVDDELMRLGTRTEDALRALQTRVEQRDGTGSWKQDFEDLIALTEQIGKPVEEDDVRTPVQPAVALKSQFAQLETKLLGGAFLSLVKQKANPTPADIEKWTAGVIDYAKPRLLSLTGATGSFVVKLIFGTVILAVATFFFLYDGPAMLKNVMYLSPLDDSYEQELLLEFDRISRAVVVATLLSAVVQGLTAGLGFAVAGMNFLTLLIMLTTVFAMVPFVGPAVVWIPVCLYLGLYEERYTAAVLLAAWGVLVVGTVDNLVKAFVLHGQSQLHPLLALLSVLGGVQALGPIGIVVGPMVVAMLQTLLSILQRELTHFDQQNLVLSTQGFSTEERKVSKRKWRKAASKSKSAESSDTSASTANASGHEDHAHDVADDRTREKSKNAQATQSPQGEAQN